MSGIAFTRGLMSRSSQLAIASATTITLGDANFFDITGTTTVSYITTTGWDPGAIVTLQFDGSVTVTHNGGSPVAGTSAAILLASASNLSATANDFGYLYIFKNSVTLEFKQ